MSIYLDDHTRVIVQGITGKIGSVQTKWMLEYGTAVVGGVTPGKGGKTVEGLPVFDSVAEAAKETGANASVFFVPAPFVLDAFYETVDAGIETDCDCTGTCTGTRCDENAGLPGGQRSCCPGTHHAGDSGSRKREDGHHARIAFRTRPRRHHFPKRHPLL